MVQNIYTKYYTKIFCCLYILRDNAMYQPSEQASFPGITFEDQNFHVQKFGGFPEKLLRRVFRLAEPWNPLDINNGI